MIFHIPGAGGLYKDGCCFCIIELIFSSRILFSRSISVYRSILLNQNLKIQSTYLRLVLRVLLSLLPKSLGLSVSMVFDIID